MNLYILKTTNTPADRDIRYFQRQLEERQMKPELIDADSRQGIALSQLYDIMQRPSVVITDINGNLLQKWEGKLPGLDDVMAYHGAG